MGKKQPAQKSTPAINVKCTEEDKRDFSAAAKKEGFNTRSGWMLFHLRAIARATLK